MFISAIIKSEYTHYAYRDNFYMKNLKHALENNWVVITNEYIYKHFFEIQDKVQERFIKEFEMKRFTPEEFDSIEQYCIPDAIFEDKEREFGSRTEMLFYLTEQSFPALEDCLHGIIEKIKIKHPNEPIEGMFYCAETCQPFRNVCAEYNIPLIPYCFSAFKIPHGYRQTLYYANINGYLYNSTECEDRYRNYLKDDHADIPVFSNRELVAMIGKTRTLPLIQLMHHKPQYEMGVCCECYEVIPQFFSRAVYSDDDIFYECSELYAPNEIVVRSHAMQLDKIQVDRTVVHNDPAPFILGCKRLAAVRSQIMLKVLLWGRTGINRKNTHAFSFMCEKDYDATGVADIKAVNYYIIGYLIPADLMFSKEYWEWRMTNPKESEIYKYHLAFYQKQLGLPQSIFEEKNEPKRFKALLESRGCDEELVNLLLEDNQDFDVDYNTASSRIIVNGKSHWRINKIENGTRHFRIELDESADMIEFYPLDDIAGCARLVSVSVNGTQIDVSEYSGYKYMPKVNGHFTLPVKSQNGKLSIEIAWDYMSNNEYLNQCCS